MKTPRTNAERVSDNGETTPILDAMESLENDFVVMGCDLLNARTVIRAFLRYVECGQIPEDDHCVKRAREILAADIVQ